MCNVVPRILKDKQNKIFVVFEILANVLLTLINWLLKPKCMLKHCFLVYEKNTIWFFSFETLGRMHKNIFSFFYKLFWYFGILMKTEYFNTWFVFLRRKIQTDIKQNLVKKYTKKLQFFKSIFEKKNFFELGWVEFACPCKQWVSLLFICNVNSGETRRRRRQGKGRRLTCGGSRCF